MNATRKREEVSKGDYSNLHAEFTEVAELEFLQALALMYRPKLVPTAPRLMEALFSKTTLCISAFTHMQPTSFATEDKTAIIHKIRLQTIYYRNSFYKEDVEAILFSTAKALDSKRVVQSDLSLKEVFNALFYIRDFVRDKSNEFLLGMTHAYVSTDINVVNAHIALCCSVSPLAARAWQISRRYCADLATLQYASLQLSDLCNEWAYSIEKQTIKDRFGSSTLAAIERLAIKPGELADQNPEHFFMNNPIWRRPLIDHGAHLCLPVTNLFGSFGFRILECLIGGNPIAESAYYQERSQYLEHMIAKTLKTGMPNAAVYEKVEWKDPASGVQYENDIVALLGNTLLIFEAKSGKISDAARRGAEKSFETNARELIVEPAIQAARLEKYLNDHTSDVQLRCGRTGELIQLDLSKPKIVHKFTVCMETLPAVSRRDDMIELGYVTINDPWAPVISLGELLLAWRHLDTEISLFHYFTRRSSIDKEVAHTGDEMDLLSLYLTNRMNIDAAATKDKTLLFLEFDHLVRGEKTPRKNREDCIPLGPKMPPFWTAVIRELYQDQSQRHRFDIIEVILNQHPGALQNIFARTSKWRNGGGGAKDKGTMFLKFAANHRTFVLGMYLSKDTLDENEWLIQSRTMAFEALNKFGASEVASFFRLRKSETHTFDGVAFHRFAPSTVTST